METITRRVTQRQNRASFSWHRQPSTAPSNDKVCKFWLAGNCRKKSCCYLHPEVTAAPIKRVLKLNRASFKESHEPKKPLNANCKRQNEDSTIEVKRKHILSSKNEVVQSDPAKIGKNDHSCQAASNATNGDVKSAPRTKICEYWLKDSCVYGDKCKDLHSWCYGDGFSVVAQLQGHKKAITGITLPSGSDKLFSSSKDGTVRAWNCHTGECIGVVDMGVPVECLISEGPWVLAGLTDAIKVWNIQTNAEFTLSGPAGQVYAMVAVDGLLFAGVNDGSILVWKFNFEATMFEAVAPLKGHTQAVVSLIYGAKRLYSGSMDSTVKVWDLETMQCIHTLAKHSEVVMSVLCWEQFLLSCSLDQTLKVWAASEAEDLEVTYEHKEEHGILCLHGMHDQANKPILLTSCNDNTVRLYDLPSFAERGKIFAKQEVRAIQIGPGGLFFTGDGTGLLSVWKCSSDSTATPPEAS
ncbi:zinc finger CCCH domain-containing protein 48-like [Chenopodium quinoa]|uniref:zinc finger CCCH domain-containing protein 48-like n=1 Tax=Chenopodium quinoa TaxID=63459 RepID=UPI000B78646D|nr:zinc finger CCCH domain-containing protein 48-like [Chenopodium quinoa]